MNFLPFIFCVNPLQDCIAAFKGAFAPFPPPSLLPPSSLPELIFLYWHFDYTT